jgi:hypothetical protein
MRPVTNLARELFQSTPNQNAKGKSGMLVHTVFFWLDPQLNAEQLAEFETRLSRLPTINAVKHGFIGKPSSTNRPIIDRTYSWGLTLVFENLEKHDEYQVDPLHKEFVDNCNQMWIKVTIYDFE